MPKRPSKDRHEPFLEALAGTRNVDKAAAAGITDKTPHLPNAGMRP